MLAPPSATPAGGPQRDDALGLPDGSEFAVLRYFALNGTDHRIHAEVRTRAADHVRRCNAHAEPKTGFAPESPIRRWTEPAKAA
ncbi:hypothetical protein [Kitasatospora sp. NPDC051914]|uniref:hypothetical protein n=1 Tax=Kitasatospora sp. NPDC051914 TaxID=3154945 RepID=UPI003449833F